MRSFGIKPQGNAPKGAKGANCFECLLPRSSRARSGQTPIHLDSSGGQEYCESPTLRTAARNIRVAHYMGSCIFEFTKPFLQTIDTAKRAPLAEALKSFRCNMEVALAVPCAKAGLFACDRATKPAPKVTGASRIHQSNNEQQRTVATA